MTDDGAIRATLSWDGFAVRAVALRSSRSRPAAAMLRGLVPERAVELVGRVHALCGAAQSAVAMAACDAATGRDVSGDAAAHRAAIVDLETIQELCTQLALAFAPAMHTPPLVAAARAVRAIVSPVIAGRTSRHGDWQTGDAAAIDAAFGALVPVVRDAWLGMTPRAWLDMAGLDAVDSWSASSAVAPARWWHALTHDLSGLGASAVEPMPPVDAQAIQSEIAPHLRHDHRYTHAPEWRSRPVETGALARMRGHSIVAAAYDAHGNAASTRLLARLTELAALLDRTAFDGGHELRGFAIADDGYAMAHTARGMLVHRAVVDDTVADYTILAPTDWNFHPRGPFAAALMRLTAPDEAALLDLAAIVVHSIDPCVACRVEVGHA